MSDNKPLKRNELLIGAVLLLALLLTRSGITRSHFGTEFNLPDASWAVFWMTGAFTRKLVWPVLLLLACVAVDYWVIAGGVSSYCFTPAYPFLIPAYFSLWGMGRWLQRATHNSTHHHGLYLLRAAASMVAGVSLCFAISNIGFYVAAGYFAQMPASLYAQAIVGYWPSYLLTSSVYAGVGVLIRYIAVNKSLLASGDAKTE